MVANDLTSYLIFELPDIRVVKSINETVKSFNVARNGAIRFFLAKAFPYAEILR